MPVELPSVPPDCCVVPLTVTFSPAVVAMSPPSWTRSPVIARVPVPSFVSTVAPVLTVRSAAIAVAFTSPPFWTSTVLPPAMASALTVPATALPSAPSVSVMASMVPAVCVSAPVSVIVSLLSPSVPPFCVVVPPTVSVSFFATIVPPSCCRFEPIWPVVSCPSSTSTLPVTSSAATWPLCWSSFPLIFAVVSFDEAPSTSTSPVTAVVAVTSPPSWSTSPVTVAAVTVPPSTSSVEALISPAATSTVPSVVSVVPSASSSVVTVTLPCTVPSASRFSVSAVIVPAASCVSAPVSVIVSLLSPSVPPFCVVVPPTVSVSFFATIVPPSCCRFEPIWPVVSCPSSTSTLPVTSSAATWPLCWSSFPLIFAVVSFDEAPSTSTSPVTAVVAVTSPPSWSTSPVTVAAVTVPPSTSSVEALISPVTVVVPALTLTVFPSAAMLEAFTVPENSAPSVNVNLATLIWPAVCVRLPTIVKLPLS